MDIGCSSAIESLLDRVGIQLKDESIGLQRLSSFSSRSGRAHRSVIFMDTVLLFVTSMARTLWLGRLSWMMMPSYLRSSSVEQLVSVSQTGYYHVNDE